MQGFEKIILSEAENAQLWDKFQDFLKTAKAQRADINALSSEHETEWFKKIQLHFTNKKQIFCESKKDANILWDTFEDELKELSKFIWSMRPTYLLAVELAQQKAFLEHKSAELVGKIEALRKVEANLLELIKNITYAINVTSENGIMTGAEAPRKSIFAIKQMGRDLSAANQAYDINMRKITSTAEALLISDDYHLFLTAIQLYLAEKAGGEKPAGYEDYTFSQIHFLVTESPEDKKLPTVEKMILKAIALKTPEDFLRKLQTLLAQEIATLDKEIKKIDTSILGDGEKESKRLAAKQLGLNKLKEKVESAFNVQTKLFAPEALEDILTLLPSKIVDEILTLITDEERQTIVKDVMPEAKIFSFGSNMQGKIWMQLHLLQKNVKKLNEAKADAQFFAELVADGIENSKYLLQVQYKKLIGESNSNMADNMAKLAPDQQATESTAVAAVTEVVEEKKVQLDKKTVDKNVIGRASVETGVRKIADENKDQQIAQTRADLERQGVDLSIPVEEAELLAKTATIEKKWDEKIVVTKQEEVDGKIKEIVVENIFPNTVRFNDIVRAYMDKKSGYDPNSTEAKIVFPAADPKEKPAQVIPLSEGAGIFSQYQSHKRGIAEFSEKLQEQVVTTETTLNVSSVEAIDSHWQVNAKMNEWEKYADELTPDYKAKETRTAKAKQESISGNKKLEVIGSLVKFRAEMLKQLEKLKTGMEDKTGQTKLAKLSKEILANTEWRQGLQFGIEHPAVEMMHMLGVHLNNAKNIKEIPTEDVSDVSKLALYKDWLSHTKQWLKAYKEWGIGKEGEKQCDTYIDDIRDLEKAIKKCDEDDRIAVTKMFLDINIFVSRINTYQENLKNKSVQLNSVNEELIGHYLDVHQALANTLNMLDIKWVDDHAECPYFALFNLRLSLKQVAQAAGTFDPSFKEKIEKLYQQTIDNQMRNIEKINGWDAANVQRLELTYGGQETSDKREGRRMTFSEKAMRTIRGKKGEEAIQVATRSMQSGDKDSVAATAGRSRAYSMSTANRPVIQRPSVMSGIWDNSSRTSSSNLPTPVTAKPTASLSTEPTTGDKADYEILSSAEEVLPKAPSSVSEVPPKVGPSPAAQAAARRSSSSSSDAQRHSVSSNESVKRQSSTAPEKSQKPDVAPKPRLESGKYVPTAATSQSPAETNTPAANPVAQPPLSRSNSQSSLSSC